MVIEIVRIGWGDAALGRLVTAGYLESSPRDRTLDVMVEVILEAKYEEV